MKKKKPTIKNTSFLRPWLDGKYSLPDLIKLSGCRPNVEDGWWISINQKLPFHEVIENPPPDYSQSWKRTHEYYKKAIEIAYCYDGYTLEHEDRYEILDTLGEPPEAAHPIYFVTVEKENEEKLVYVGQSASKTSRFSSGHHVATKLLAPDYDGFKKYLYYAQVMLYNNELHHVPLELISDQTLAKEVLNETEKRLIYFLQPVLNERGKKKLKVDYTFGGIIIEDPYFLSPWLETNLV